MADMRMVPKPKISNDMMTSYKQKGVKENYVKPKKAAKKKATYVKKPV